MSDFKEEFVHIRTSEFLVEDGEDEELFNEGTYGAALATYLENELNKRGYMGGAILEDWGYWIGVDDEKEPQKAVLDMGVYCSGNANKTVMEYVVVVGGPKLKKWNWSKFKFISLEPQLIKLQTILKDILKSAPNTEILSISDVMPI